MGQRGQDYVLSGIVELDDAYFGAPKSNGKRGRPNELEYTAVDEDELKLWLFERAAFHIALKMELINRAEEEKNWRYVQDHAEHGAWLYRENRKFQYNAIHDSREYDTFGVQQPAEGSILSE